ncbi:hypothetical protein PFISCL1PPCAC_10329, partial [Pristionchus fissidentatus]
SGLFSIFPLPFLLLLSPLANAPAPDQESCGSIVLKAVENQGSDKNAKPTYNKDKNEYTCANDMLIYIPEGVNEALKIEYVRVLCKTTNQWTAEEMHADEANPKNVFTVWKTISRAGTLECKGTRVMSCEITRFDFDDMSLDPNNNAKDPNYNNKKYTCVDSNHHLFLKRKFSIDTGFGHYLRKPEIECKNQELRAEFSHIREPQKTDYRDTITCKEFSCKDTLDPPLSYFNLLQINTKCPNTNQKTCKEPDFYNDEYPCGTEGHELTLSHKDKTEEIIWLKDHYVACVDGHLIVTDFRGKEDKVDEGDTIRCFLPESCPPLMNSLGTEYGCKDKYDCYEIDPTLIPTDHLSVFDGNCYD